MSILDKLLEKKDIEAYLEYRIEFLKITMTDAISKLDPKDREFVRERFKGRISELGNTLTSIREDDVKTDSKWYYEQIYKIKSMVTE